MGHESLAEDVEVTAGLWQLQCGAVAERLKPARDVFIELGGVGVLTHDGPFDADDEGGRQRGRRSELNHKHGFGELVVRDLADGEVAAELDHGSDVLLRVDSKRIGQSLIEMTVARRRRMFDHRDVGHGFGLG